MSSQVADRERERRVKELVVFWRIAIVFLLQQNRMVGPLLPIRTNNSPTVLLADLGNSKTNNRKPPSPTAPGQKLGLGSILHRAAFVATSVARNVAAAADPKPDGGLHPLRCCLMSLSLPWDTVARDLLFKVCICRLYFSRSILLTPISGVGLFLGMTGLGRGVFYLKIASIFSADNKLDNGNVSSRSYQSTEDRMLGQVEMKDWLFFHQIVY